MDHQIRALPADALLLYRRANAHAEQGQWDLASEAFAASARLLDLPRYGPANEAIVKLASGDLEGCRSVCDRLIAVLAESSDALDANALAWTLALTEATESKGEIMPFIFCRVAGHATQLAFCHAWHDLYLLRSLGIVAARKRPRTLFSMDGLQ